MTCGQCGCDCTTGLVDVKDDGEHWVPDLQLVPALLAQPRPMRTLVSKFDRFWAVAGLKEDGYTAEDIADRLRPCSLRQVRTILSNPVTKVFRMYFNEANTFGEELRLAQHELRTQRQSLDDITAEEGRVRAQRDRMIDAAICGEPVRVCRRAGHLMDRYNTYRDPRTGKTSCRLCRYNATRRARGLPEITELCQLATVTTLAESASTRVPAPS